MCFVCLILTSQNIYRGAVIFVESQNISQLMDENRKRIFDGFLPEADWAFTHLQKFLSKQCKREPRWCKFFIWLKLLGSLGSFLLLSTFLVWYCHIDYGIVWYCHSRASHTSAFNINNWWLQLTSDYRLLSSTEQGQQLTHVLIDRKDLERACCSL